MIERQYNPDASPGARPVSPSTAQAAPDLRVGGVLRALGATLLWSTSALIIDQLGTTHHLTALEISTWRVLLVLPILAFVAGVWRPQSFRMRSSDLPIFFVAGIVGITLSYVSWAASVHLNGPAVGAALSFSAPTFIAIGDRVFFHAKLNRVQVGAIAVNLIGCGLAAGLTDPAALFRSPAGLIVGTSNGLAFSAYTLMNRGTIRTRVRDPLTVLIGMFTAGAIGLLAWGGAAEGSRLLTLPLDSSGWFLLIGLAVGPTLLAYALFNSSLRQLSPTIAGLIITLEPPSVAIFAVLLLGRTVTGVRWLGIGLIVVGVMVMQLAAARDRVRL